MRKKNFTILLLSAMAGILLEQEAFAKKTTPTDSMAPAQEERLYVRLQQSVKDEGMFGIYRMDDHWYFEIPDSLFQREMLLITRRAQTAMDMGFGGELLDERVFVWEKRDGKTVDMSAKSYRKIASPDSDLHEAVVSCMRPAIIQSLPILDVSPDSSSVIVDVTELFRKDNLAFNLNGDTKRDYKIGALNDKSSYIKSMKSFPDNVEVRTVKTYSLAGTGRVVENEGLQTVTLEFNNSLLLLPEKPMRPRYADERVGYFYRRQWDYSDDHSQESLRPGFIKRWRLEPKDMDAFRRGELVEPVKPIIYYISPSVPEQWVPYFIQGVEDWQPAFEAAGLKNAILARPCPTPEEDPDFDLLDARYSIVEYFASYVENSYGPHVSDPRSGEIINTHVCIFHNALKLVHDWYMIQCGAQDPEGRKMVFNEELMGRLVRYLVSHEVGHTLGLMHNFVASKAYPVDSLRSATFTQSHGTTPSIMDYARFNYVAQPEDKGVSMFPQVGEYDRYAIEWGYRPIPDAATPEEEVLILNEFVKAHADDPRYRYVRQFLVQYDPRSQTEDLGDDVFKATELGLKNLEYVFDHLQEWTALPGQDNRHLEDLYEKACRQWRNYMRHVSSLIGGVYEDYKSADQPGEVYHLVEKDQQKAAVEFLSRHAIDLPDWISAQPYISRFDTMLSNIRKVQDLQGAIVHKMLNLGVLLRLTEEYAIHPETAYNPVEYLQDVQEAIWKDLYEDRESNVNLRVMQRVYMDDAASLISWKRPSDMTRLDHSTKEFPTLMRISLKQLQKKLKSQCKKTGDPVVREHYLVTLERIGQLLQPVK